MTLHHNNSTSWAGSIRRQLYQLILLLVALVLVQVGYEYWSQQSNREVKEVVDSYHLAGNTHYLRAIAALNKIQNHHALKIANKSNQEKRGNDISLMAFDDEHLILQQLIHGEISQGLALETAYADSRFKMLGSRIEQLEASLNARLLSYEDSQAADAEIISDVDKLLAALEQVVRLHAMTRANMLAVLDKSEHRKDIVFFVLIATLLFLGLLASLRSCVSINRVIKEQLAAQKTIEHQAHFDSLTGLPNRLLSMDRLSMMIKDAQRAKNKIAVLFLDLDHFKKVNDTLGHLNGDRLLVEAAQRLQQAVRGGDTVGRLGGDEFIILLGGISSAFEVRSVANDLISAIGGVFQLEGREFLLSASVGISIYPEDGVTEIDLIRKADTAMYHSKELGRNTFSYFTDSINRNLARQLSLEQHMHGAIDRGEFEVYYQQKVDYKNNRIVGAEALLRWNNPELGMVSPVEFIPVAEQTGLIIPIGQFVLAEALKMTQQWQQDLMPDFSIAVNLSPRQFRDPDLVPCISKCLREFNVSNQDLELEITEGVVMDEHHETGLALATLNRIGVRIAMDDFGTGYSSLNNIRNYPFDVIKIDRSFVKDIDTSSMSRKLTKASISMAHSLDISVVAEGVETLSQLTSLTELDCDIVQGFYFGKPMPAPEMTALLASGMLGNESAGNHGHASAPIDGADDEVSWKTGSGS